MAGILEYSTTPGSNTTINGIGISGGSSIKYGNDAIMQFMADVKSAVTKLADKSAGTYTAAKSDHNQLWRVTGNATINLTAAATLTAGWALWVMADGGTATIEPAGSEKINGADTLTLTSGNSAFIVCTATAFRAIIFNAAATLGNAAYLDVGTAAGTVAAGDDGRITGALQEAGGIMTGDLTLAGDPTDDLHAATKQYVDANSAFRSYEVFTASGTWTKPDGLPPNALVRAQVWGGGGGGTGNGGGGGGGYNEAVFKASDLTDTVSVTVGAGGAIGSNAGGTSWFGAYVGATGGAGGPPSSSGNAAGGYPISNTSTATALIGDNIDAFKGARGSTGTNNGSQDTDEDGLYGGGGGSKGSGRRGLSVFGGSAATSSIAAEAPGGGGHSSTNTAGARGEVRVWIY